MRILVTGGAGFIGSHLTDAFQAAGHTVAILDDYSTGKKENHPEDIQVFVGSIADNEFVDRVIKEFKPDVISHHAAQTSVAVSDREPELDARLNIIGTLNILEAVRKNGLSSKVIYPSSGGTVYGNLKHLPADEETPKEPVSHYGLSKYVGEEYLGLYSRISPLRFTVLRYTNIYGPRQDPHGEAGVCAIFAKKMLAGEPCTVFGDGINQTRDYVFIEDVVEANLLALTKGDNETVNISTGEGTATLDVFSTLKASTRYTLDPVMGPPRPGDAQQVAVDPSKAERVLGWKPKTSFKDGIDKTVEWFRNQG